MGSFVQYVASLIADPGVCENDPNPAPFCLLACPGKVWLG